MTLRLGFVGVGRWARKLAESFRACGAEVVAFDRGTPPEFPSCPTRHNFRTCPACATLGNDYWGHRMPWRDQLADKSIDAIIAVAPPEVTTGVAMACGEAGKAVMATKPLFDHPDRITAPFYVDFWRLWSGAHQRAKAGRPAEWKFYLFGSGPFRDFPGMFDYGPHAMAAILDLGGELFDVSYEKGPWPDITVGDRGEIGRLRLALHSMDRKSLGKELLCAFGNGATHGVRNIWGHTETPTHIGDEPKEAIMQKFCRAFMADVSEGFVSTTLLDYSREGMRLLREIRSAADAEPRSSAT